MFCERIVSHKTLFQIISFLITIYITHWSENLIPNSETGDITVILYCISASLMQFCERIVSHKTLISIY